MFNNKKFIQVKYIKFKKNSGALLRSNIINYQINVINNMHILQLPKNQNDKFVNEKNSKIVLENQ